MYSFGKPSTMKIITQATFKGYYGDVLDYIEGKRAEERDRKAREAKEQYHASLVRQAAAGPIDLAGEDDDKADSDIEMTVGQSARPASASVPLALAPAPVASPAPVSGSQAGQLRLTLQVSKDQKYTVAIRPEKKVIALVKYYLKEAGLDKSQASQVKIIFDGDELDHGSTLEEADVEDECKLEIKHAGR